MSHLKGNTFNGEGNSLRYFFTIDICFASEIRISIESYAKQKQSTLVIIVPVIPQVFLCHFPRYLNTCQNMYQKMVIFWFLFFS